jgi:hypothetical protein
MIALSVTGLHANPENSPEVKDSKATSQIQSKASPWTIVDNFYNSHDANPFWSDDPLTRATLFSNKLAKEFTIGIEKYGQFLITFDPFLNGQDAKISKLVIHPATFSDNRAFVKVSFCNFDQDNLLIYSFVAENDQWKLDEIASVGGEFRWLLTEILHNP